MAKTGAIGWLLNVLRYGLCIVAIVYLYYNVPWTDTAKLTDGTRVRVLAERGADVEIRRPNGQVETIPSAQLARLPGTDQPAIEHGILTVVRGLNANQALLALLLFLPVPLLSAQRLIWMLRIQEVSLTLPQAIKLTFLGNFFNFALPGTTGGDLIKAYYITRYTHHKTEAVTTVFLDRVIGLLGLMLVASIMLMFSRSTIDWNPRTFAAITGGLGMVWLGLVAGCVVVFSNRLRRLLGLHKLVERLPAGQHLMRIGRATVAMRRHAGLVALSLGLTMVLQFFVVFSAYIMALALGMKGGFILYFIGVPIGFLIAAIPISPPQAIGVMEAAYIQFFSQGELNMASQSFALALLVRAIQLFWALPGVLVMLAGTHVPNQREMDQLESDDPAAEAPVAT